MVSAASTRKYNQMPTWIKRYSALRHPTDLTSKSPFQKLWRGQPFAVRVDGAVDHEADHGEGSHGFGDFWRVLVIPGQSAPAFEPGKCSFRHPAARQHEEALCASWAADDEQDEAEQEAGKQGRHAIVAAVGEHGPQPAPQQLDAPEQTHNGQTTGNAATTTPVRRLRPFLQPFQNGLLASVGAWQLSVKLHQSYKHAVAGPLASAALPPAAPRAVLRRTPPYCCHC